MAKPSPTTLRNPKVEISTDGGATWTDISGFFTAWNPDGGERDTGEAYVATDDTAVMGVGKRKPWKVDIGIVYTEGASDAWALLEAAWRNATPTRLRVSPRGGNSGDNVFTFGEDGMGYITKAALPGGEVSSADPVVVQFTYTAPDYTVSTLP